VALVRLFVYGSLRRGHAHHAEMRGARFVAVARTLPEHALAELDGSLIEHALVESRRAE